MDWVKKHYDLAILGLATFLLVANAGWIAWLATTPSEDFAGVPPKPPQIDKFEEPDFAANKKGVADATEPAKWQPDTSGAKGSLFVSRKYLLKDGKLLDPIEGGEMLHPPIPNAWFDENGLDLSNSRIKELDADGDGFTNFEEFEAKTNPKDKTSTPPSSSKLQLVAYKPVPFRIIFKGDGGTDGKEFQINFMDLKGAARTQFKKKGEQIADAPYKIIDYTAKPGPFGVNVTGDLSELKIENTNTGQPLTLIYNQVRDDPTSFGEFRNLLTNEVKTLKKGEEFEIPPDPAKFKLIDINGDSAQIQDVTSGKTLRIFKSATPSP
jgi:hypothetical protein